MQKSNLFAKFEINLFFALQKCFQAIRITLWWTWKFQSLVNRNPETKKNKKWLCRLLSYISVFLPFLFSSVYLNIFELFFFLFYYKTTSCSSFSLNASGTMHLFGSFKEMKTGSHYRKIKAIQSQTLIHFLALRLWLTVYKFNTIFRVLQHPEGIFTNVAAFHTFADLANDRNAFCK